MVPGLLPVLFLIFFSINTSLLEKKTRWEGMLLDFLIICTMVQKSLFRFPLRPDSGKILLLMVKKYFPKNRDKLDESLLLCCLLKEHCNGNVKVMVSINVI